MKLPASEHRTLQQIEVSYRIERELADRLRNSTRAERPALYLQVYDEWHRRLPQNPMLDRKADPALSRTRTLRIMRFLKRFITAETIFLEIGAGDCHLSRAVAAKAAGVCALEVSREIMAGASVPDNVQRLVYDGFRFPVQDESVALAYSNQILEHIHPDDVPEHLSRVHTALAPGGRYVCITPNRLSGPHDISKYFDPIATGFHLREYTVRELVGLFRDAGFSTVSPYIGAWGCLTRTPTWVVAGGESLIEILPLRIAVQLARRSPCRQVLGITLVGTK